MGERSSSPLSTACSPSLNVSCASLILTWTRLASSNPSARGRSDNFYSERRPLMCGSLCTNPLPCSAGCPALCPCWILLDTYVNFGKVRSIYGNCTIASSSPMASMPRYVSTAPTFAENYLFLNRKTASSGNTDSISCGRCPAVVRAPHGSDYELIFCTASSLKKGYVLGFYERYLIVLPQF